jgi:hypothetical protein
MKKTLAEKKKKKVHTHDKGKAQKKQKTLLPAPAKHSFKQPCRAALAGL